MNTLPDRPSLEHLKAQAKALLAALGTKNGAERFAAVFPDDAATRAKLADAQHVIAREYGFESWPRLKAHVEQTRKTFSELCAALVACARDGDVGRAEQILRDHPDVASAGLIEAGFAGNLEHLRQRVNAANINSGEWTPLLCVCASTLMRDRSRRQRFADCATFLIGMGADPNASVVLPQFPDSPLSTLYWAGGYNNSPEVAEVLLRAGANPNDNESLYHACDHRDHAFLRLLLKFKVDPTKTNALKRILDFEDREGLELVLQTGADPNEFGDDSVLHHALRRGRSPAIIRRLIEAGANPSQVNGHGATPYNVAVAFGMQEAASVIADLGGDAHLSETAEILQKAHRGEELDPAAVSRVSQELPDLVHFLAERNQATAIRALLAAGHPVSPIGTMYGYTPLHQACHSGNVETVRALLDYDADLTIHDKAHNGTPLGWAMHGALFFGPHHDAEGTRYRSIVQMLIDSGTPIYDPPEGRADLEAMLREELERRKG